VPTRSFLAGVRTSASSLELINERTSRAIASSVEIAATSETRNRGLLGRDHLDPSAALIIAPCSAIHMFFMRFAIDAVFVDKSGRVLKIVHDLRPWRIAISLRAHAVVEMKSGNARANDIAVGDVLSLRA